MKKIVCVMIGLSILIIISACGNEHRNIQPSYAPQNNVPVTQSQATTPQTSSPQEQFIGEQKAKEIALAQAGLAENDAKFTKVKLEKDDGIWKYEIEFRKDFTEYEMDINALDGNILSWEID